MTNTQTHLKEQVQQGTVCRTHGLQTKRGTGMCAKCRKAKRNGR